jgi:hypothetical protein
LGANYLRSLIPVIANHSLRLYKSTFFLPLPFLVSLSVAGIPRLSPALSERRDAACSCLRSIAMLMPMHLFLFLRARILPTRTARPCNLMRLARTLFLVLFGLCSLDSNHFVWYLSISMALDKPMQRQSHLARGGLTVDPTFSCHTVHQPVPILKIRKAFHPSRYPPISIPARTFGARLPTSE